MCACVLPAHIPFTAVKTQIVKDGRHLKTTRLKDVRGKWMKWKREMKGNESESAATQWRNQQVFEKRHRQNNFKTLNSTLFLYTLKYTLLAWFLFYLSKGPNRVTGVCELSENFKGQESWRGVGVGVGSIGNPRPGCIPNVGEEDSRAVGRWWPSQEQLPVIRTASARQNATNNIQHAKPEKWPPCYWTMSSCLCAMN